MEFQAEIDNHGVAQGKVAELTVTTPGKEKVGALPGRRRGDGQGDSGGQGGELGGNAGAADGKHAKHAAAAGGKGPAAGTYRILGGLIVGRGGKLSVRAGRTTVQFELADEPKISVDLTDLNLVRNGDKVSVKGMTPPNRPGPVALASEVKIELAEPLTGPKKKAAKPEAKPPPSQAGRGPARTGRQVEPRHR